MCQSPFSGRKIPPLSQKNVWRGGGICGILVENSLIRQEVFPCILQTAICTPSSPGTASPPVRTWPGGAVAHGVSEICFTDHFDILDIDGSYNPNYDWAPAREQQQLALAACGDKGKDPLRHRDRQCAHRL